jgi:outer membrane protein assembly factor BamD (BamD/ComL family)
VRIVNLNFRGNNTKNKLVQLYLATLILLSTTACTANDDTTDAALSLYNQGISLYNQGNLEEAINIFDDLIKKYESSSDARYDEFVAAALRNKGDLRWEQGKLEEATVNYS